MANHITITWASMPSPVSGYNVYRNGSNFPLNNAGVTQSTYTDYSVFPGNTYTYDVTSIQNGVESVDSLTITSTPVPFLPSPAPLNLASAAAFGLLAATTITHVPGSTSSISGNIGLYPGTSVTGFEAPVQIQGDFHIADYVAMYAQTDFLAARVAGMALPNGITMSADIGGQRLTPGVYKVATSLAITGTLMLDAQANPNAVWIFQIGSTLITAAGTSSVVLVGGAQAANVFWLVGSSATLGVGTQFAGNVLAQTSITVNTSACVNGRLMANIGAITLDTNDVIVFAESVLVNLPLAGPNVAPAPPASPTGLSITSEA